MHENMSCFSSYFRSHRIVKSARLQIVARLFTKPRKLSYNNTAERPCISSNEIKYLLSITDKIVENCLCSVIRKVDNGRWVKRYLQIVADKRKKKRCYASVLLKHKMTDILFCKYQLMWCYTEQCDAWRNVVQILCRCISLEYHQAKIHISTREEEKPHSNLKLISCYSCDALWYVYHHHDHHQWPLHPRRMIYVVFDFRYLMMTCKAYIRERKMRPQ